MSIIEQPSASQSLPAQPALSRRTFVGVLGAGVLVTLTAQAQEEPAVPARGRGRGGAGAPQPATSVNARVHIAQDGSLTVLTSKVEMGQGARAEITQAAAEELCVSAADVNLIMADTDLVPNDGGTFGSRTTGGNLPQIRRGVAAARLLLIQLAARTWSLDASAIKVQNGKARHTDGKQTLSYADLATDEEKTQALAKAAPAGVTLIPVADYKVLGTSVRRANLRDLVMGRHKYPSDTQRPGMLYGKILRAPSLGARLESVDLAPAKAMKDVVAVQTPTIVGVAAPTSFAAQQALEAIAKTAKWTERPSPSDKEIFDYFRANNLGGQATNPFAAALSAAPKKLQQSYNLPYVQHAQMETDAACAEWDNGKVTVWLGTQDPFGSRSAISQALSIPLASVRLIAPDFGGGFGGRNRADAGIEAATLARAFSKPVQIRWTRAEQFTYAQFRPAAAIDIQAGLDPTGKISSWYHVSYNYGSAALDTPYNIPQARSQQIRATPVLREGSYRSLAAALNVFARESFMDELAALASADPLEFRLAHLDAARPEQARLRAVLEAAAKKFNWVDRIKKKDPSIGVGLACGADKGSVVAACVEIALDDKNVIRVREVCQAFECGPTMNPDGLQSQIQGGIVMGLGGALREEILFEKGVIKNPSFWNYLVPRFKDLPQLDVIVVDRPGADPVGAGETPLIAVAPAIASALYHATGERIRRMPIKSSKATA